MKKFRFSLHDLLTLRRRELREIEMRAAAAAAQAESARQTRARLLQQLRDAAPAACGEGQRWLMFHQAADLVRRQADDAGQDAEEHDAQRRQQQQLRLEKQVDVEALETLSDQERDEHRRQQTRGEEAERGELILRQWHRANHQASNHDAEPTVNDG